MSDESSQSVYVRPVPLFPLPNVVVFPGTTQPLHVFEARYREMVRDALNGPGLVAMALLRPGYERLYHTNRAEIHRVVCVGQVREHAELPDGRYLLNLHGLWRARVVGEERDRAYRRATVERLPEPAFLIDGDGVLSLRAALYGVLSSSPYDRLEEASSLRLLLQPSVPLGRAVDMLAYRLVPTDEIEIKQRILEELDPFQRGTVLLEELRSLGRVMEAQNRPGGPWPRDDSIN